MPTINGNTYSSTTNLDLVLGLLRFGVTFSANPFGSDEYGLYVAADGNLTYSALGVAKIVRYL